MLTCKYTSFPLPPTLIWRAQYSFFQNLYSSKDGRLSHILSIVFLYIEKQLALYQVVLMQLFHIKCGLSKSKLLFSFDFKYGNIKIRKRSIQVSSSFRVSICCRLEGCLAVRESKDLERMELVLDLFSSSTPRFLGIICKKPF